MRNHPRLLLALLSAGLLLLTACPSEQCGNGRVEGKEQCDDGNTSNGDGCSRTCTNEVAPAVCGNGEAEVGEACDDGNSVNGDGCQNDCSVTKPEDEVLSECGNGKREIFEACDDGNKTDGDGCESTCVVTPLMPEQCAGAASLPQPEEGATCKVTPGAADNKARLYMGVVLMDGKTLIGGQVLVDDKGVIACSSCDCSGVPAATGATSISCPQGVISPALINAHDHIDFQRGPENWTAERYEHRHDWRVGGAAHAGHTRIAAGSTATDLGVRWAELRQVMAGTTAIVSSGGRPGFLRDLNSFGTAQEGLGEPKVNFQTFPIGDSAGEELESGCGYKTPLDSPSAIPPLSAYMPHIAEGISTSARNEFLCLSGQGEGSKDVLTSRTAIIHGVGLTAVDIAKMAERGTGLIWSPRTNIALYGDTAMVTTYKQMGVNIALGTDWLQAGSMNILRELRCASYLNQSHYSQAFTDEELWRMVTVNAADLTDIWEKLGRIAPGKVADLAIFKLKDNAFSPHRAVIQANPDDVVLTVRGGKPLYGDKAVVDALTVGAADPCEELPVCGSTKAACVKSETGKTLAELRDANKSAYDLFFCSDTVPTNEPTCEPQRTATTPVAASQNGSTLYTGARRLADYDGDGVANAQDNCPIVFNPVRPMDNGAQADTDGDTLGDACDPCPLAANSTTCTAANPADEDGDGILSPSDNCPGVANADQEDTDGDFRGDVCDACPTENPGDAVCEVSLYDVKKPVNGVIPLMGYAVTIPSAVVTAIAGNSYFIQIPTAELTNGPEWSGAYVFNSSSSAVKPAVGDHIKITSALVADYFGRLELTSVTFTKLGTAAQPTPIIVAPSDVNTGGSRAAALESVVVELHNVFVSKQEPTPGTADSAPTYEFVVDTHADGTEVQGVRVNDIIYQHPMPAVGTEYRKVRGILELRNGNSKVEPRNVDDLLLPPPPLASLGSSSPQFIRESTTCSPNGCSLIGTKLLVTMASAYPEDLEVTVGSSDTASLQVAQGGKVIIPKGLLSAEVKLIPLAMANSVTLTATLGPSSKQTTVRVLGTAEQPTLNGLTPRRVLTAPSNDVTLVASLDIPAPANTTLEFVVTPPELGSVEPATVTFGTDATRVPFTFKTSASATPGTSSGTITARFVGASTGMTSDIEIVASLPELVSITPSPVIVFQGTTQPFTVTLNGAAPGEMLVKLVAAPTTAGAAFGSVPVAVPVAAGASSATFDFAADATASGTGTIKASLGTKDATANVTVRLPYPKIASLSPTTAKMIPNATRTFTVKLDKNAEPGGFIVALTLTPSSLGTVPATVTIAEGTNTANVTFTSGAVDGIGKLEASNTLGAGSKASADITVETLPPHVVISEFAPQGPNSAGTGTTATNEFIELYNPTSEEVDLAGWVLQYKSATGSTYAGTYTLPTGAKIAPNGYYLVTAGGYIGTVTGDASYGTTLSMAAGATGGGHVRLGMPGTSIDIVDPLAVDTVGYGTGNSPEGTAITPIADVAGSFERKAYVTSTVASMASGGADMAKGNGYDSDNNSTDFVLRTVRDPQSSKSPTEQP